MADVPYNLSSPADFYLSAEKREGIRLFEIKGVSRLGYNCALIMPQLSGAVIPKLEESYIYFIFS